MEKKKECMNTVRNKNCGQQCIKNIGRFRLSESYVFIYKVAKYKNLAFSTKKVKAKYLYLAYYQSETYRLSTALRFLY